MEVEAGRREKSRDKNEWLTDISHKADIFIGTFSCGIIEPSQNPKIHIICTFVCFHAGDSIRGGILHKLYVNVA